MTLRVIGAGVGRTGTKSLKLALEKLLGGRCSHCDPPPGSEAWLDPLAHTNTTAEFRGRAGWD